MKKKDTMVRYTLVPDTEDGNVSSNCLSKCPKLSFSKSKIIVFVVILAIALGIILLTVSQSNTWIFTKNMTDCLVDGTCKSGKPRGRISGKHHSKLDKSQYKKRLPQVLVIGARKAGTRALLRFLNLHDGIEVARHESHFFDRNFDNGYDWYKEQMPESLPGQITLEKTPNYFVDLNVPKRVYTFNSSIKLMLILRNPVDRALSDYLQLKLREKDPNKVPPFEHYVIDPVSGEINKSYSPLKRSLYCKHLERWLEYFNLSQILFIDGEKIRVRPWEEMHHVENFLGLDHQINKSQFVFNATKGFYCMKVAKPNFPWKTRERCLSPAKGRVHPEIDLDVEKKLEDYFRPCNNKLFEMIGRRYDW